MELYLVRHGYSEGNAGLVDTPDPALTPMGREQARLVAERLASVPIRIVFSSPMLRALETGAILARALGVPHEAHPDLCEKEDGDWLGMDSEAVSSRFPGVVLGPGLEGDWRPRMESPTRIHERAQRVERMIRDRWEAADEHILVVSHGDFGAVLLAAFVDSPSYEHIRFSQHNCCITQIEIVQGRRAKLRCVNRVDHLPPEMLT